MAFEDLVRGARVALVGGAASIDEDIVKNADVVARVNSHWVRQRGRVELLYFSAAPDLDYSLFQDDAFWSSLRFMMLNISHRLFGSVAGERLGPIIAALLERKIPFQTYCHAPGRAWQVFDVLKNEQSFVRALAERYDFHPLTGMLALEHLLLSSAREVSVTGMTLYRAADGQLPAHAGAHGIVQQLQFLNDAAKNPKLRLDETLSEILSNYRQRERLDP
jgi:hypothetical protein